MYPQKSDLSINRGFPESRLSSERNQHALPYDVREAFRFFQQPEVQRLVLELQQKIFDFMLSARVPLEAVNWQTERGDYVVDGKIPLALSRFGDVDLVTGEHKLSVGRVTVAQDSPFHRQEFVDKSSSESAEKTVFQLRQVTSWAPLESDVRGDASGFVLSDRLALAAEIVMTKDYMFVYAQIAGDIFRNEQDAGEVLLEMKVGANLDDCLDAARYCRTLEERMRTLDYRVERGDPWKALKGPFRSDCIEEAK